MCLINIFYLWKHFLKEADVETWISFKNVSRIQIVFIIHAVNESEVDLWIVIQFLIINWSQKCDSVTSIDQFQGQSLPNDLIKLKWLYFDWMFFYHMTFRTPTHPHEDIATWDGFKEYDWDRKDTSEQLHSCKLNWPTNRKNGLIYDVSRKKNIWVKQ